MSAVTQWNAIPLSRPSVKHSRPDYDDDDADVSLVSRSPSPASSMDVDADIHKYDEYARGVPREIITVETKLKPSNKGFALLAKLGWVEGQPLGISGEGRVDPIPFQIKTDLTGLGKTNQDVRMIETTVSQRRGLDSERQQKETEDQRRAREDSVARKSALESEISWTLKAFYCTLCDKQFKTVAQYDEHTNSYAHHHKARFKDMQANVRLKPREEVDKRKEKERKREEKELRKIAAANGIKMMKPTVVPQVHLNAVSSPPTIDIDMPPAPSKKGGWAVVTEASNIAPQNTPRADSSWASVEPKTARSSRETPSIANETTSNPSASTPTGSLPAPIFRTAGWTSLDTGSSQPTPPPQLPNIATSSVQPQDTSRFNECSHIAVEAMPAAAAPPPPPQYAVARSVVQPTRSGWQQFQKSGPKRR